MTSAFERGRLEDGGVHRSALVRLRQLILAVIPRVEEVIRRGVPAFRYRGRPLVSIGAARDQVSLFVMYGSVLKRHAAELEGYDTSNTVVRFGPDEELPIDLVTNLVRARTAEVDALLGEGMAGNVQHATTAPADRRLRRVAMQ